MVFSCHECGIGLLSGIRGIGQPSKECQIKWSGTIREREIAIREMAMRVKGFEGEKEKDFNQASQFYISCGVLNRTPKRRLTHHELIHVFLLHSLLVLLAINCLFKFLYLLITIWKCYTIHVSESRCDLD